MRDRRETAIHLFPKPVRMGLTTKIINITKYPLAIGLFIAVGLVMITEHLEYLVYVLGEEFGLNFELFSFDFPI